MNPLVCMHIRSLLARRAAGLSESERLEVDGHCAECARCEREARVFARIRSLHGEEPVLSSSVRELLLRRAFELSPLNVTHTDELTPTWFTQWRWALGGIVAIAATATIFMAKTVWNSSNAVPGDHVLSGALVGAGHGLEAGATVPVAIELGTQQGASIAVGNAEVELEPGSKVSWDSARSTLELRAGGVRVAVEHQDHVRFRVSSAAFLVEVVGTRFEVHAEGVKVTRGTVRVMSPDGRGLLAVLPAGGSWAAPVMGAAATSASVVANPPSDLLREPNSPGPSKGGEIAPSVSHLLNEARRALAARRINEAQQAIDAALRLHPALNELAEARTLQAECLGDDTRALRAYLAIAQQFPTLPAAENALFAAARTQARLGGGASAQRLFERYLKQYPAGRFRQEAERHVAQAGPMEPKP